MRKKNAISSMDNYKRSTRLMTPNSDLLSHWMSINIPFRSLSFCYFIDRLGQVYAVCWCRHENHSLIEKKNFFFSFRCCHEILFHPKPVSIWKVFAHFFIIFSKRLWIISFNWIFNFDERTLLQHFNCRKTNKRHHSI